MSDVWVIGGTSGIGLATVNLMRGNELDVVATDACTADVRDEDQMRRTYRENGEPSRIVYSAGITALAFNKDIDMSVVKDIFDVNVMGFIRLVKIVSQAHEEGNPKQVRIAVVTSDAATRPMRTSMAYCASKAALDMAVKQAAREMAPWGKVNGVAPGMTSPTGMSDYIDATVPGLRGWSEEGARGYETSQIPMGRRAHPAEIATVIEYLLMSAPPYQTGSITVVNGGR